MAESGTDMRETEECATEQPGTIPPQSVDVAQERELGWATGVVIHEDFNTLDSAETEAFGA
jgi:hypothetical protein